MDPDNLILASAGFVHVPLSIDEAPQAVIVKIEALMFDFAYDVLKGRTDGAFTMIKRTSNNAIEDGSIGAIVLGGKVTVRKLNAKTALSISRLLQVTEVIHSLLLSGRRTSQRELFYLLIESFQTQQQLNDTVLDVSAVLGVPRYALNVGAATRGVLAGCLQLSVAGSMYRVDCRHVGMVQLSIRSTTFLQTFLKETDHKLSCKRLDGLYPVMFEKQHL